MPATFRIRRCKIIPGFALCFGVTVAALGADRAETRLFGRPWLDALVLAILVGTAIRTAWTPPRAFDRGIDFSAKTILEIAVVLLGLSVSSTALRDAGPALIGGIAVVVAIAITASYGIGRLAGLSHKLSLLIACGNSICGNSAIAATAPVIRASNDDIAASIAFTAVLGVAVVLLLPLAATALALTGFQYGVFAGLTVYAVPQVIAATAPVGALSVQVGTLVKLVRVLMLGPVVLALSVSARQADGRQAGFGRLVPGFILAFLAMIAVRATGLLPQPVLKAAAQTADLLTVMAMAALGLGVDVRVVARAGGRVTSVVVLSLAVLATVSLGLIGLLAAR